MPTNLVARRELVEQINAGIKGPLTVISAPAGFGKTNLLIEWASQTKHDTAWLTVGPEDNDLVRFLHYITSTLQEVKPDLGLETLDLIHTPNNIGLELGMTLLLNEISELPDDLILVIDDFHLIQNQKIHESLNLLLKYIPPNFHLVIASRQKPPLDIASLRAKGSVKEIAADELRFSSDEIAQFFLQTLELQLSPDTITTLEEQTKGWVTALKLIAISSNNQSPTIESSSHFHGDSHYLADFLTKEVLNQQSETVQKFLLQSSILDVLNGPLCEAVIDLDLPPGYGKSILKALESANLFLSPIDQQHQWFRYHPLFAEFLRHMQNKSNAAEIPELYKRAAVWFEEQNNLDEAFRYALASEDGKWAAQFIEPHIETIMKSGEILSLSHWIGMLPIEIVHLHPTLSLAFIWGAIVGYQLDDAKYWIEEFEQSILNAQKKDEESPTQISKEERQLRDNLLGGLAICRSTLAITNGDVQEAYKYSKKAESYLKEDNPFILSMLTLEDSLFAILKGDTSEALEVLSESTRLALIANNLLVLVTAKCRTAKIQALQGDLSLALVTLQKAQLAALRPDGPPLPITGFADIEIGDILRERNQLEEAKEHLERGLQLTKGWWSLISLDGSVSLARLLQNTGDITGAKNLVSKANELALSTASNQWDNLITSAVAVRLALQRNDFVEALHWWGKSELDHNAQATILEKYPYHVSEYLVITQARFYFVIGKTNQDSNKLNQALDILASILPRAEQYKRMTSKIEILMLQALVQAELGQMDIATSLLLNALALGEPENYRRIFLDEGQPIVVLLKHCQEAQQGAKTSLPSSDYIAGLLEEIPTLEETNAQLTEPQPKAQTVKLEDGYPISLSYREIEVLNLIAAGKTNQEISAKLCISLNTVKRHAYNIYRKLEVQKRTQAVAKARQFGIIP